MGQGSGTSAAERAERQAGIALKKVSKGVLF